jgi:hypothetical protein
VRNVRIHNRLLPLLATLAAVSALLLPVRPAGASNLGTHQSCTVSGSMHVSNGIETKPLASRSGVFAISSGTMQCVGSDFVHVGGRFSANGNYGDPSFTGVFTISLGMFDEQYCSGSLSATRVALELEGNLANVTCNFGSRLAGTGTVAFDMEPNPVTLNTCAYSGTQPVVCDYFVQGTVTYHRP